MNIKFNSSNNSIKKIIYSILIFLLIVSFSPNLLINATYGQTTSTNNKIGHSISSLPTMPDEIAPFGDPTISPEEPNSDDTVTVSLPINDLAGLTNATLYWHYSSLNNSEYSTSMTVSNKLVADETEFSRTGYITDTGVETNSSTDWRFGEYNYIGSKGEVLNKIDVSIKAQGNWWRNYLVYVLIEAYNITSNQWEVRYEDGTIGGKTDVSTYPAVYTSLENVTAYHIYAITYIGAGISLKDPIFNHLYIYSNRYSADILPPDATHNVPTWVDYYVKVFDLENNSLTSETNNFLMDWRPSVSVVYSPPLVYPNSSAIFNVSVTDNDGYSHINKSDVHMYYWLEGDQDYQTANLTFLENTSDITALFQIKLNVSEEMNKEALTFYYMVNATDIVNGSRGREGTTGTLSLDYDGLNPQVLAIKIDGGISIPGIENITLINSEVNVSVQFSDPSGIKEVYILYSMPNGTEPIRKKMTNITEISQYNTTSIFTAILPPANDTEFVEYFFETRDYLDNVGNTSVNLYYADGAAPLLESLLVYPPLISNITNVRVLFNASDYSNLKTTVLWYSYDNGLNWSNTIASAINYASYLDYLQTFTSTDVPFIVDINSTSYLKLHVEREDEVSTAQLSITLSHPNPTDMRVWLVLEDGTKFLIFDREPKDTTTFTVTVDLTKLGLTQKAFTNSNFTLEIINYSHYYSGKVTAFSIKLTHYSIPYGYQYLAVIPASVNDTTVQFYLNLTDRISNSVNSSIFSYYSDGLAPNITIIPVTSPVNLNGADNLLIKANVTDKGGISSVELYYRYSELEEWSIITMYYSATSKLFECYVPVTTASGNITFLIKAYDQIGYMSVTNATSIIFENGLAPIIDLVDEPYSSPYTIDGTNIIRIRANVTDDGQVTVVKILYRFNSNDEWEIMEMKYDNISALYFADIALKGKKGELFFKVLATDNLNLTSETDLIIIGYEITNYTNPLVYIISGSALGVIAIAAIVIALIKKRAVKK